MSWHSLPPLNALRAFEVVARHLSFSRAAAELNVTPAALSHQIRALEEQLGSELFFRRARGIELTESGRSLYPGLHAGFESVREAVRRIDRGRGDRILVVSTTVGLAAKWFVPRLWRFIAKHPELEIRVSASMSYADFAYDGVDAAIRLSDGDHPELYVERLVGFSMLPLCSPKLVEEGLRTPQDLARFTLIHYNIPTSAPAPPAWADWLKEAGVEGVDVSRGLHLDASDQALDAAASGAGVALSYRLIASDDMNAGRLVQPFGPEIHFPNKGYHLVCPRGLEDRPKVRAFRDWVTEEMAKTQSRWVAHDEPPRTERSRSAKRRATRSASS